MGRERPIRVLIAKPGLDGHDRGAKVIARGLMDAGMEVIYLGIRHTPDQIAQTALEEDVDVVGLSILSGAHMKLVQKVMAGLKERGVGEKPVILGGVIPRKDIDRLKEMGVAGVFGTGSSIKDVVGFIRKRIDNDSAT